MGVTQHVAQALIAAFVKGREVSLVSIPKATIGFTPFSYSKIEPLNPYLALSSLSIYIKVYPIFLELTRS